MKTSFIATSRKATIISGLSIAGLLLGACSSTPKSTPSPAAPTEASASTASPPAGTESTRIVATETIGKATSETTPAASPESTSATTKQPAASKATRDVVLPVTSNPIVNAATAQTLKIDSILVENNVDAAGKTASDHLEIALRNTGTTPLTDVEIYYTFSNPVSGATESYFTKLPAEFSIPGGGTRVAHFDNTGASDHFPVSKFSLYYVDTSALDVRVVVSAGGAAVQRLNLKKDAGGPEAAD
jgi:hypothetical protein